MSTSCGEPRGRLCTWGQQACARANLSWSTVGCACGCEAVVKARYWGVSGCVRAARLRVERVRACMCVCAQAQHASQSRMRMPAGAYVQAC